MADETAKKAGARPPKAPRGSEEGNKSAFILSFTEDTPAAEIVKAGAAKGLIFSPGYVSTIRSLDRKRKAKAGGASSTPARRGRKPKERDPELTTESREPKPLDDAALVQLILQYGVVRVEKALARVKSFR